jgi:ferredoxin-NADP reductase
VVIRPGHEWPGHRAGQYLRIGLDIEGVRHWRAYSLTSDPDRPDGCISVTVKNVDEGTVSPYLVRRRRPGSIVSLGGVEGSFVLPDPPPSRALFISAGSGVTPIMSMVRSLERSEALNDVVHIHSARTADDVIFGSQLRALAERHPGFRLHEQLTAEDGRLTPDRLEAICPDWRERETFLSGPAGLLDEMVELWEREGDPERLRLERFQPRLDGGEKGEGGSIHFSASNLDAESDGSVPILLAGEQVGATLPYGCREGICHTCVGRLCSGRLRDLRTGDVYGSEGEMVRTCISAPEGAVEIDL